MPWLKKHLKHIIGGLVFLVTFIIYIKTLCPTVPPRDSGELITAAYTLGIAHPPGYPLFVLIGKLFTLIPLGSIAWRVNSMSAFFASATVTISYFFVLSLTGSLLAAATSALLLAFAPIFWGLAVVAEVFQLNVFFTALTIYLLWLWKERGDFRLLLVFAFIYGLSFCNHHTMALLAPGFLYFIWTTEKEVLFKLKNWFLLGLCFAAGLVPYIYLPLRSMANPYLDWGDPQTIERFLFVVTRKQFGSLRLDPALPQAAYTLPMIMANLKVFLGWLIDQFTIIGFLLGLAGLVVSFIRNRRIFNYFTWLILISGLFFFLLASYPFHIPQYVLYCSTILRRFMLPAFLVFTFWVGLGIADLETRVGKNLPRLLVFCLVLLIPLFSLTLHYKKADMSRYYYVADLIDNVLLSLKPNSIIFGSSDTTLFSLWYMQGCEGKRPDVRIFSSTPQLWRGEKIMREWPELVGLPAQPSQAQITEKIGSYRDGFAFYADLIRRNAAKIPIYTDLNDAISFRRLIDYLAPNGLVFKFMPTTSKSAKLRNLKANYYLWGKYSFRSPLENVDPNDYPSREILTFYAEGHNFSGLTYAINHQYAKAEEEFNKALAIYANYRSASLNLQKLQQIRSTK